MSRDFSPRECWMANEGTVSPELPYGIWLQNIRWVTKYETRWAFTEEEIEDRKKHRYLAVLATNIYADIKRMLSPEAFDALNEYLGRLVEADFSKNSTAEFPKEVTDWYFNKHNHHYREPNDESFMEYIRVAYEKGKTWTD